MLFSIRTSFDPAAGPINLIFAFEAVIIGGLGSLWGTLLGGVILGVSQSLGGSVLGPFISQVIGNPVAAQWQILTGHIVFIIVLIANSPLVPSNALALVQGAILAAMNGADASRRT